MADSTTTNTANRSDTPIAESPSDKAALAPVATGVVPTADVAIEVPSTEAPSISDQAPGDSATNVSVEAGGEAPSSAPIDAGSDAAATTDLPGPVPKDAPSVGVTDGSSGKSPKVIVEVVSNSVSVEAHSDTTPSPAHASGDAATNASAEVPVETPPQVSVDAPSDTPASSSAEAQNSAATNSSTDTAADSQSSSNVAVEAPTSTRNNRHRGSARNNRRAPVIRAPRGTNNIPQFQTTLNMFTHSADATKALIGEAKQGLELALKRLEIAERLPVDHPQRQKHFDVVDGIHRFDDQGAELLRTLTNQRYEYNVNMPANSTGLFDEYNHAGKARLLETIDAACDAFKVSLPKLAETESFKKLVGTESHFEKWSNPKSVVEKGDEEYMKTAPTLVYNYN